MYFILSKLLNILFAPFTWIIVFSLVSLLTKNTFRKRRFAIISILFILFFSNTFIFDRFMHAWEVNALQDEKIIHFDGAILLVGNSSFDPEKGRLEFKERTDRIMQTINLYKKKKIGVIILSGGPASIEGDDTLETPMIKQFLVTLGIAADDIIIENHSRNTYENSTLCKQIIDSKYPGGKFLLVSSGWHLRRATSCFIKRGINVIPYSTDRLSGPMKYDFDYLIIPSSAVLFNWEILIHEWVGMIVYKLQGHI